MEIYPPGTEVLLGTLPAIINQVCIQGQQLTVTYQLVWWAGGNRKCEWVSSHEINCSNQQIQIGFK